MAKYRQQDYSGGFQGSAQSVGFNPIKAIDESKKYKQQTDARNQALDAEKATVQAFAKDAENQLRAQQAQSTANFATIKGLATLSSTFADAWATNQANNEKQDLLNQEVDAAFGLEGGDGSAIVDRAQAIEGDTAERTIAAEKGITETTDDPLIQNSIRQEQAPVIKDAQVRRLNVSQAAQQFPSYYNSAVTDLERTYTRPDGSTFSVGTVKDAEDIALIDATVRAEFYRSSGLSELPTAQVANALVPTVRRVSESWTRQVNSSVVEGNIAEAKSAAFLDAETQIATGGPSSVANAFRSASADLFASGGYIGQQGKANEDMLKSMLQYAIDNNRPDIIDALERTAKRTNADGTPVKGTELGRQYRSLFKDARNGIVDSQIEDNRRDKQGAAASIETGERQRLGALAEAQSPEDEVAVNLQYAEQYEALGTPEGRLRAEQLRAGSSYSPFTVTDMKQQQDNGEVWTNEELAQLVTDGDLKLDEAKSLGYDPNGPTSAGQAAVARAKTFESETKAQGNAAVVDKIGKELDSEGRRQIMEGVGKSTIADINDRLQRELAIELQTNPKMSDAEIRQWMQERGKVISGEVSYTEDGGLEYAFGPKQEGTRRITTTKVGDTVVMDVRNIPASQIDAQIIPDISNASVLTTREMAIADAAYASGTPLPPELEAKASALGTNGETLLRSQHQFRGSEMPVAPIPVQHSKAPRLTEYDTGEVIGDVSLDQLRSSVISKESGNDFTAVNPDSGALGFGQVMPANVASWSRAALGYSISQREFLRSPEKQMAVINHQFRTMMQQQSALGYTGDTLIRRVSSIWYSGQAGLYNNTRPQTYGAGSYPSIASYTLDVVNRYRN